MVGLGANTQLQQKLSSRLVVSPQLAQSLKILAMDSLQLEQYLDELLQSNPLLERDPNATSDEENEPREQEQAAPTEDWDACYFNARRDSDTDDREQNWHSEELIHDRLHRQLACEPMEEHRRQIAGVIIDSLDDDGYFRADSKEVSRLAQCTEKTLWDVLCNTVQQMEPAGIAARDLIECLMLQLDDMDEHGNIVRIASELLSLEAETLTQDDSVLATRLACSTEDIARARQRLRRLDPSPGRNPAMQGMYIYPELCFHLRRNREIEVEVRRSVGAHIRLNAQWQNKQWNEKEQSFMQHAEREADWLMQALAQRTETLTKAGIFLANHQKSFLINGPSSIRPLTLAVVAEACGVHESTISRITHGKYAQTPLGLIELRHFFAAGLETRHGESIAVPLVLRRIRNFIAQEPATKPLSDQEILQQLSHEGISIARRTVSKYREQLGIPSSRERKKKA